MINTSDNQQQLGDSNRGGRGRNAGNTGLASGDNNREGSGINTGNTDLASGDDGLRAGFAGNEANAGCHLAVEMAGMNTGREREG
uniref:Uncharacterized protein n=1 Tax=Nelumbo nucifera TaxID=4432 RepID=A0A822XF28_NELNU|nr:TPA_asm: hypothetical protein HUJ06_021527 [Nelumbo nucifera]